MASTVCSSNSRLPQSLLDATYILADNEEYLCMTHPAPGGGYDDTGADTSDHVEHLYRPRPVLQAARVLSWQTCQGGIGVLCWQWHTFTVRMFSYISLLFKTPRWIQSFRNIVQTESLWTLCLHERRKPLRAQRAVMRVSYVSWIDIYEDKTRTAQM